VIATREPERVLADVRNEYVSIEAARNIYRVAITGDPSLDPEGLQIDATATEKLRATSS
jgi:N-methylhydantoinase B